MKSYPRLVKFFVVVALGLEVTACASGNTGFSSSSTKTMEPTKTAPVKSESSQVSTKTSANATTKGSFTAWTVPSNPGPGDFYVVHILVNLPAGHQFKSGELKGSIHGTDGYAHDFASDSGGTTVSGNQAQLQVDIPGGMKQVQDTIQVNVDTKGLKESQNIVVTFK